MAETQRTILVVDDEMAQRELLGSFVESLAAPGRVNIAATSPEESAESVLAEFFLRALETGAADGEGAAAKTRDGRVTLLEALNWASYQTALWISRLFPTA